MLACTPELGLSKLERARRFYTRARQTRTGLAELLMDNREARQWLDADSTSGAPNGIYLCQNQLPHMNWIW